MNLTLTTAQRHLADQLIRITARDGADATSAILPRFPVDVWPALVAYLARVAAEARAEPVIVWRSTRNQPDVLTEDARLEAHRLWRKGLRTPEVILGEREYQRVKAREVRARKRVAA